MRYGGRQGILGQARRHAGLCLWGLRQRRNSGDGESWVDLQARRACPTPASTHRNWNVLHPMGKRSRDPIDIDVAKRVRALRLQRGLRRNELSDALGVTFQQVQKYERGANRISAGRLFRIAKVLDVPVAFFYGAADELRNEADGHPLMPADFDFLQTSGAM